jgi:hypothetical protein
LSGAYSLPLPVVPGPVVRFAETTLDQSEEFGPCVEESKVFGSGADAVVHDSAAAAPPLRRSARSRVKPAPSTVPRRLVRDRWFYEPVLPAENQIALVGVSTSQPDKHATTSVSSVSDATSPAGRSDSSLSVSLLATAMSDSGDPPPFPGSSLLPSGESSGRFQIHLRFPNEELPSQSFMVSVSMTVPVLESAIARLMRISPPLSLFVAPRWALLDHPGFIVDRFLSDMVTPCPYLEQDSVLRVLSRRIAPLEVFGASAPLPLALLDSSSRSGLDFAPEFSSSSSFISAPNRPFLLHFFRIGPFFFFILRDPSFVSICLVAHKWGA